MTANALSDHDLTQALFRDILTRQPLAKLHRLRATMRRAGNTSGVRLVDDELQRRGVTVTATAPQGESG